MNAQPIASRSECERPLAQLAANNEARRDPHCPANAVLEDSIVDEGSPGLDTVDALDENVGGVKCVFSRCGRSNGGDGGDVRMYAGGWCLKRIERGMSVSVHQRRITVDVGHGCASAHL